MADNAPYYRNKASGTAMHAIRDNVAESDDGGVFLAPLASRYTNLYVPGAVLATDWTAMKWTDLTHPEQLTIIARRRGRTYPADA